jgi:hypothetical protein
MGVCQDYQEYGADRARPAVRCARGEHCAAATTDDGGATVPDWADSPVPFCRRDTGQITRAVMRLPEQYVLLHMALGEKTRLADDRVSGSRTPPVPLRLDVDALIWDMVLILCSWDERVADAEKLTRPATWLSRYRRHQVAIPATTATLAPRLRDVLCYPPQSMFRVYGLKAAELLPADQVTRVNTAGGYAEALVDLDGAGAGLEFLRLERRCRHALGQTLPPPADLDGIPCRRCDHLALQVAPELEYRSCCSNCGDLLTPEEYKTWVDRYAAWARRQVCAGELNPADVRAYAKLAS